MTDRKLATESDDKLKGQTDKSTGHEQADDAAKAAQAKLSQESQAALLTSSKGSELPRINDSLVRVAAADSVVAGPVQTAARIAPGSSMERVAGVLSSGVLRTPEGIKNAIVHDANNLPEAGIKLGVAASIGVAMKTLLPKTGVGKAIVGTVMIGAMVKDVVKPLWESVGEAKAATTNEQLDSAATKLGNGLGMFAWDAAAGSVVGLKAEKLTGRVLESTMGSARYAAFENKKVDIFSSDEHLIGRSLNAVTRPIDKWTTEVSQKLAPKPPEIHITPEAMKQIVEAQAKHAADYKSVEMYLNGVAGADGKSHGFSQTMDLLQMGLDPRKVSSVEAEAMLARQAGRVSAGEPKSIIGPEDHFKGKPDEVPGNGGNTPKGDGPHPGDAAKIPGDVIPEVKPPAGLNATYVTAAERELNVVTLGKMAEMNKQDMAKWTDDAVQIEDALGQMIGPVHAATIPSYKPLDPGYLTIRNAMVQISQSITKPEHLQQVYPLFSRAWQATNQHIGMGLSDVNSYSHEFNLFGREIHSSLVANMKKAGIDPDSVLRSKNPPLFSISADGGSGPHTMRQIDGVWPLDHVLYPRNMVGTRSTTSSGIYGHEIGHDQYGGILKFDESIREQVIKDAVKNGLIALEKKLYGTETGKIGAEKVTVPGHGEMTKADLYENIFKAQADENTADIWGAAWTGHNGGGALGILLQSLRKGGKLETRNVYGKEFVDPVENPLGFEVHAFDAIRPKIVAETMRARANGDKHVLEQADALDRYAKEASNPGDYVFGNIQTPAERIVIPRQELEAVVPELIRAQMNTPLPALQGKTFGDVLPDLPSHMAKMEALASLMADAIVKGRKPSEIPFDTSQYTINQVFGSGMPAALKLVSQGMDATKANAEVNRMSDYLRSQYHANDPHITPLRTTSIQALKLTSPRSLLQSGRILGEDARHITSRVLGANEQIREAIAARTGYLSAAAFTHEMQLMMDQGKEVNKVQSAPGTALDRARSQPTAAWLKNKDTTISQIVADQKAAQQVLGQ